MSENETQFVRTLLMQVPGSFRATDVEGILLQMYASSDEAWSAVCGPDPRKYLLRLAMHALVLVPECVEHLKNAPWVAAVDNIVHFIVRSCERTGLPWENVISRRELGKLRREALLRSARFSHDKRDDRMVGNLPEALTAHALMAGISVEELSVTQEYGEKCLQSYLYKYNPKMKECWDAACADAKYLNDLFAAAD